MSNAYYLSDITVENILLFYFLTYIVLSLFFKPDKLRIYCGVFAFCGPTNLTKGLYGMILSNIKLIGLQNDSRGGDNAGILINNKVIHTKGLEWKFYELLQKNTLENPNPEESTVIIGHCRKSSVGGKDQKFAHPFKIYKKEDDADFFMAGVHNGTISNWKDLAENYAIDPSTMDNDSKTLLTILSRQRNLKRKQPVFRVLEQYKGFGVFIWYFIDEPNTLYVFKGATTLNEHNKTLYEERPLFYYECPVTKGIYFSSLKEPLDIIASDKTKVSNLPSNIVFKIVEGKFIKKEEVSINREDLINYTETFSSSRKNKHVHYVHGQQKNLYEEDVNDEDYLSARYGTFGPVVNENQRSSNSNNIVTEIFSKSLDSKKEEEKTKSEQIQTQNSSLITSKIKDILNNNISYSTSKYDIPLKSLSDLAKEELIYRFSGLYHFKGKLLTGAYLINKTNYKCYEKNNISNIELQKELKDKPFNIETKYFFEGYMLKDITCLEKFLNFKEDNIYWKTDKVDSFMSHYCSQPVPGLFDKDIYYISGNKANFRLEHPPYSENKIYHFNNGKLELVMRPKKEQNFVPLIVNPTELKKMAEELNIPYKRTAEEVREKDIQTALEIKKENNVIHAEETYIIDANEENILELYNELLERCKEQMEFIKPFVDNNLLKSTDFLSGNFHMFFKDSIENCLLSPSGGKDDSPYFVKDGGKLSYKGIKEIEEFTVF